MLKSLLLDKLVAWEVELRETVSSRVRSLLVLQLALQIDLMMIAKTGQRADSITTPFPYPLWTGSKDQVAAPSDDGQCPVGVRLRGAGCRAQGLAPRLGQGADRARHAALDTVAKWGAHTRDGGYFWCAGRPLVPPLQPVQGLGRDALPALLL